MLDKLARLRTCCQHRVFPLCFYFLSLLWRERFGEPCTTSSSDNFQLIQSWIVAYRQKLEELQFVDEEFPNKKINNKDVYI